MLSPQDVAAEALTEATLLAPNGTEWRRYLRSQKIVALPSFLAMKGGAMKGMETSMNDKASTAAGAIVDAFMDSGVASAATKALPKDDVQSQLCELYAYAAGMEADCLKRMKRAAGMKTDVAGKLAVNCSELWGGIKPQRAGRGVPDRERGNDKLTKMLAEHLYDAGGRKLPMVELAKIKSAADDKGELENEEGAKEGEKKEKKDEKGGQSPSKELLVRNLLLLGNSMAAVCSAPVDAATAEVRKGCGAVTIAGVAGPEEKVLDASWPECMEFTNFLVQKYASSHPDEILKGFAVTWASLMAKVAENGDHHMQVATAMLAVREEMTKKREMVMEMRAEGGGPRKRGAPVGSPKANPGKRGKGGGTATAAARLGITSPPKTRGDPTEAERKFLESDAGKAALAAASGAKAYRIPKVKGAKKAKAEICRNYRRSGQCMHGEECRHRHIDADDDSDAEDVRER